ERPRRAPASARDGGAEPRAPLPALPLAGGQLGALAPGLGQADRDRLLAAGDLLPAAAAAERAALAPAHRPRDPLLRALPVSGHRPRLLSPLRRQRAHPALPPGRGCATRASASARRSGTPRTGAGTGRRAPGRSGWRRRRFRRSRAPPR